MHVSGWQVARVVAQYSEWLIAIAWCARAYVTLQGLPRVADLSGDEWLPDADVELPSLLVVVPALNEAANIRATVETLAQQRLPGMHAVLVDDRSTDETGAIMDEFGALYPDDVTVLHVRELPRGWLGKTHAMQLALTAHESEWVLFTDADVLFAPSVLLRVMRYAVSEGADHVVVPPTMQVRSWGEGTMLGFFTLLGSWAVRPWRVADPEAKRDTVGVGAFNLVRRAALAEIGGLEPQRMTVLEDITLGRRIKNAGLRQRIAFAPGLVLVRWAEGARGIIGVMTKNLFSAFNFRLPLALLMVGWIAAFCVLPLLGVVWWHTLLPALLFAASVASIYASYGRVTLVPRKYAWSMPAGAAMMCWALLRSVYAVLRDGGVRWRGTLYPLRELRRYNSQWRWMREGQVKVPPVPPLQ